MITLTILAAAALASRPRLEFPLACQIGRTCEVQNYVAHETATGIRDYRCGLNTYAKHSGTDIRVLDMAAQRSGVAVLAAANGRVARLRDGVPDVSIRTPGAPSAVGHECGNAVVLEHGDGWETQYCHMAKGSVRAKVGDQVHAGQAIGMVGLSGDTEFPHLHITVRHLGQVVDPFAAHDEDLRTCTASATGGMWGAGAALALDYPHSVVLNVGFSSEQVTMAGIEMADIPPVGADSPFLIAYARAINLEVGDIQVLRLSDPQGATLAETRLPPLQSHMAQYLVTAGVRRTANGWKAGAYTAHYTVVRAGKVALTSDFVVKP